MITNKDISIDKDGNIILNGDKYPLASQAEIDVVKGDIDDLGDTIGDITQTGVTGATVAAQLTTLGDVTQIDANLNYSGKLKAYKCGRIVNLQITGVVNATLNEVMSLTSSLPVSIRPLFDVDAVGYYSDSDFDSANNGVNFRILSNGSIRTYSYKAFTAGTVSVTYIVAQ